LQGQTAIEVPSVVHDSAAAINFSADKATKSQSDIYSYKGCCWPFLIAWYGKGGHMAWFFDSHQNVSPPNSGSIIASGAYQGQKTSKEQKNVLAKLKASAPISNIPSKASPILCRKSPWPHGSSYYTFLPISFSPPNPLFAIATDELSLIAFPPV
jgi:hypothetical protein